MRKEYKFGLVVISLIVLILILNLIGVLSVLNQPLNNLIAGTPDKTCVTDSDCSLKDTACGVCDCGDAVNKDWSTFCPFKKSLGRILCKPCPSPYHDFKVKCIENQCQKVVEECWCTEDQQEMCNPGTKEVKIVPSSCSCERLSDIKKLMAVGWERCE